MNLKYEDGEISSEVTSIPNLTKIGQLVCMIWIHVVKSENGRTDRHADTIPKKEPEKSFLKFTLQPFETEARLNI
jgi:hypothetical protein